MPTFRPGCAGLLQGIHDEKYKKYSYFSSSQRVWQKLDVNCQESISVAWASPSMLCIIDGQAVEEFHTHLNSQKPTICFTMELEAQGHLLFLDTGLRRRTNGELIISVYRKPTHTDRYLQFHSHHPAQVKRGLVKCLFDRARDITRGRELNLNCSAKWEDTVDSDSAAVGDSWSYR